MRKQIDVERMAWEDQGVLVEQCISFTGEVAAEVTKIIIRETDNID